MAKKARKPLTRRARKTPRPATRGRIAPTRRSVTVPVQISPAEGLTIVGVGASAGGLEAFTQLLESLDSDAGITLVLVQHLSPHHDSALVSLLAPHTGMPVVEATEGVHLQPNQVYVIPPNAQMVLDGSALHLTPRPGDRTAHTRIDSFLPIDSFFTSLAAAARDHAIAVVLSGTASDGAVGIRDVKAAGGITFAQTPASAKFDGMPRAAIATGAVDAVLTPSEIGGELSQIARHPYTRRPAPGEGFGPADDQLKRIFELLQPASGVDFRHYKQPTVRRRVLRRMALHRIRDIAAYINLLESSAEEVHGLFQDLLIHVTSFFREPDSFDVLAAEVFPRLIARAADRPIRAWVCGCATGEEAYSLAIALLECLQSKPSAGRVQIFATDVSDTAVEKARAGVYPAGIAADVGPDRLRRFFTRSDGHYRVGKQVRDLCVFARQDLTKDPPFSRLDLVMCRNVLIYMNAVLQRKLISMFHYALVPDGHLMLGQAESIGPHAGLFTLVDKHVRLYRKKADYALAHQQPRHGQYAVTLPTKRVEGAPPDPDRSMQVEVSRLILDRYSPAGVVVDAELQIVQVRGQTGSFLEAAQGEASLNLLRMLREGLLYGVRSAFQAARKSKRPARRDDLRVRSGNGWREVNVEVLPLGEGGRQHYLVLFEHARAAPPPKAARAAKSAAGKGIGVKQLQRELDASREYMRAIIQELEAANEELQSANEEILSSNEELQSTNEELDTAKEELQSANEELNTVNEELQARNDELSRVNSDLVNLVGSVQIAIVIVGGDLRIRRFTPMAEKILNLIPADLDRSIAHINPNIDCPNLADLIVECIDSVSLIGREVRDRQGHWFAMRIRPYKSLDNKIDGAVLALFDIDILKRSEQSSQRAQEFTEGILEGAGEPIAIVDRELRVTRANSAFAALADEADTAIVGRPMAEIAALARAADTWRPMLRDLAAGVVLPDVRVTVGVPARPLTMGARAVPSPDGTPGIVLIVAGRPTSSEGAE
jgi:two-component system, chemotaxis family, CheB/CheR fusion protein